MTVLAVTRTALVCSVVLLAGCGGSSPAGDASPPASSAPAATAPAPTAGWTVGTATGIATDEDCTATVPVSPAPGRIGVALDDLVGMVLDRKTLRTDGAAWQSGMSRGFLENQEQALFGFGASGGCGKLKSLGRVTGYASQWIDTDTNSQTSSGVDLFLTESGAADYLAWYPTLMKVGDSAGEGVTVSAVTTSPIPSLGAGAVTVDITANGWFSREVVFRVQNIVGSIVVGARAKDGWSVDPQALASTAQQRILSATVSDSPLDAITALSIPLQRKDFPVDLQGPTWDAYFGGALDATDAATMATDADAAKRLADHGYLYAARGLYTTDGSVPRVSTSVTVYATAEGAAADRKALIDDAASGNGSSGPAVLFDVGIPGAVGWTRTVADGDTSFVDTRVLLPVDGRILPIAFVHEPRPVDRRADVTALAKKLLARIDAVTGV